MSTGDINSLLNDPRINTSLFRFRARKALITKFGKTEEEANILLPKIYGNQHKKGLIVSEKIPKEVKTVRTYGNQYSKGNLTTIKKEALKIAEEDGIEAAIEYIIGESNNENSAMTQISLFKSELKGKGKDVTELDNSERRKEIQEIANENIEKRREEKLAVNEFFIHPNFSYDNVVNRLAIYEQEEDANKLNNMQFITDMIIAFAARTGELYSLKFVGDKITGQLKTRDNTPLKYAGMYTIPVAKQMLNKLPKDLDLRRPVNEKKLNQFMQNYNMKPRDLRTIGADYTTKSYIPQERRKIRQLALRHKKLSTSLESYQMPINIK